MSYEENEKIKEIRIEDFIWVIYFFIAIFAIISDQLELDDIYKHSKRNNAKVRTINLTILTIAFLIYIYFVYRSYKRIGNLKATATRKEVIAAHASLISSLLFIAAGIFAIYAEYNSAAGENELLIF